MKNIHIMSNTDKDLYCNNTKIIKNYLESKGCFVTCQELVRRDEVHTEIMLKDETECVIVLGGDGTFIETAGMIRGRVPMIGVNLGNMGYLAEVDMSDIESMLDRLIRDEFVIEKRMMLSGITCCVGSEPLEKYALNDIVIARTGAFRIVNFSIFVNDQLLNRYNADGIIVSTPTGSTGYNLSAGGPIVEPDSQMILVTPICPHTLNTRAIVLSAEDKVRIVIGEGPHRGSDSSGVFYDGGREIGLLPGDYIDIKRAAIVTDVIKMSKESFLKVLSRKMDEGRT